MAHDRQDAQRNYRIRGDVAPDVAAINQRGLPNVFVVGAAKSGTTALYHYFQMHPEVYVPETIKETNYMAFYDGLPPLAGPGDKTALAGQSVTSFTKYRDLYGARTHEPLAADVSPAYLYYAHVPRKIAQLCPSAKIVMILRNPVEFTFSMYAMMRRDCREPCHTFREAFQQSPARMAAGWEWAWDYQQGAMFSGRVARYLDAFPRRQLFIRRYDDLNTDPRKFYRDLTKFLGILDIELASANRRVNGSPTRRDMLRKRKVGRWLLRSARAGGFVLPDALRKTILDRILDSPAFVLLSQDRRMLVDHFADEIHALGNLLSWELTDWLRAD